MCDISVEKVIDILKDTLEVLQSPDNIKRLEEARANVGNEMFKVFQLIFPIVMQVQKDVLLQHGVIDSNEGIISFTQIVKKLEKENAEIENLNSEITSYWKLPISINTSDTVLEGEKPEI